MWNRLFGGKPKPKPLSLSVASEEAFAQFTKRRRQLNTVGFTYYQDEIERGLSNGPNVLIDLVPEPTNPHDSEAICVHLRGVVVGHLSRINARTFKSVMAAKGYAGYSVMAIPAFAFETSQGNKGLTLMMPSDIVVRMLSDEETAE